MISERQPKAPLDPADELMRAGSMAVGCAVGLWLSAGLSHRVRHSVAWSLAALGVAATVPWLVRGVRKQINAPTTKRWNRRVLRSIRDGGVPDEADYYGV